MQTEKDRPLRTRKHPWRWLRSLARIIKNPNNTADGARIVLSFNARQSERNYQRFAADPIGRRILDGDASLFELLCDHEALRALPEASLGRTFLAFSEAEGISVEALDREARPIEEELWQPDAQRSRFLAHVRASHDLWHVLTGYSRDLLGEILLLRFSYVQLRTPVFGFLTRVVTMGINRRIPGARALLDDAESRSERAGWLPSYDWAALLPQPIEEVRDQLRIGSPPIYTRYRRNPKGFGLVPEEEAA